jgi:hypothetical protein
MRVVPTGARWLPAGCAGRVRCRESLAHAQRACSVSASLSPDSAQGKVHCGRHPVLCLNCPLRKLSYVATAPVLHRRVALGQQHAQTRHLARCGFVIRHDRKWACWGGNAGKTDINRRWINSSVTDKRSGKRSNGSILDSIHVAACRPNPCGTRGGQASLRP